MLRVCTWAVQEWHFRYACIRQKLGFFVCCVPFFRAAVNYSSVLSWSCYILFGCLISKWSTNCRKMHVIIWYRQLWWLSSCFYLFQTVFFFSFPSMMLLLFLLFFLHFSFLPHRKQVCDPQTSTFVVRHITCNNNNNNIVYAEKGNENAQAPINMMVW